MPPSRLGPSANNPQLEDGLGGPLAEKLLGLKEEGASSGLIQTVGNAVGMLLQDLGVTDLDTFDSATGGLVTSAGEALGIDDLDEVLGMSSSSSSSASAAPSADASAAPSAASSA